MAETLTPVASVPCPGRLWVVNASVSDAVFPALWRTTFSSGEGQQAENTRVSSYFEDKCRKLRMNSDWHLSASLLQSSGSCLVTGTSVGAHPYPVVMGCFLRGRSSLPAEQPCRAPPSGGNHCLTIESAESARKSILCPGPEDVLCSEINRTQRRESWSPAHNQINGQLKRNSPRIACRRMQGISPYGLITSPCALKNKPE
ncbi:uncharacterized protein LOC119513920 isoform X2 [Choloepus didactylus]|uniref:uncharacterized protein LOC119513920 isoform X2 n=1 Tax=Choloepus didactylus TaxID=27675 RepID=UPI00189F2AF1|nr:uncharacterized protein LOC119513920 isoform X2 [Choloepus didactylus]